MACSQTLSGIVRDCNPNAGGLSEIFIANADDVTAVTMDTSGEKIASVTMATGKKFKKFYFKPRQAGITFTPQFNEAGEYAGEDGVLTMNFGRIDTTKRVQVAALSVAELVVIYRDNNGFYWYIGKDAPVLRNGGDTTHGTQKTDYNHFGIQLHSQDKGLPYEVDADAIDDIVG